MSLNIYLDGTEREENCICRECGHKHTRKVRDCLFQANITHNLAAMAKDAGIYDQIWKPENIGITKAVQLIEPLRKGLELMKSDPPRFKKYNASNGWGLYEDLIWMVEKYLQACEENPDADISVSR